MHTRDVVEHFGSRIKVARALGISKSAVHQWGDRVPEGTAYKLQVLTGGKLRVDRRLYETDQPRPAA